MRLDNKEKILKTINNQNNENGELEAPWWKESSVDNRNSLYERRRYKYKQIKPNMSEEEVKKYRDDIFNHKKNKLQSLLKSQEELKIKKDQTKKKTKSSSFKNDNEKIDNAQTRFEDKKNIDKNFKEYYKKVSPPEFDKNGNLIKDSQKINKDVVNEMEEDNNKLVKKEKSKNTRGKGRNRKNINKRSNEDKNTFSKIKNVFKQKPSDK